MSILIETHFARCGRNLYNFIDTGTLSIKHQSGEKIILKINNGNVIERIDQEGENKTIIKYGESFKHYVKGSLVQNYKIKKGTNTAKIFTPKFYVERTSLGRYKGRKILKTYGGGLRAEKFIYTGGKVAYSLYRGQKKGEVYRPNGKLWFKWKGELDFAWKSAIFTLARTKERKRRVSGKPATYLCTVPLFNRQSTHNYSSLFHNLRRERVEITLYDYRGKIVEQCAYENGQKVGKAKENYRNAYYIRGVKVSRALFYIHPDKISVEKVINERNIQLKTALLEKIGYEKVLKKLKATELSQDLKGNKLYSVQMPREEGSSADRHMNLLQVKCPSTNAQYVLRVPPNITSISNALQWTFGVQVDDRTGDIPDWEKGREVNLIEET